MSLVQGPNCAGCVNQEVGERFVKPSGNLDLGVLLVGDSPWKDEVRLGWPFAGAAGYTLDHRLLAKAGYERDSFVVANSQWCKPPHLGWTDHPERFPDAVAAMEHCRPHLDGLIERLKPKAILAMGNVAMRRLTGMSGLDGRHAKQGYLLQSHQGVPVVGTFHPSFIQRPGNWKYAPVFQFALRRVVELASGRLTESVYRLMLDPEPGELRAWVRELPDRVPWLVVDIETDRSHEVDEDEVEDELGRDDPIVRFGASARQGEAFSVPWTAEYRPIIKELLDKADRVVEHASNHFDSKRLRANGMRIRGKVISSMWMWHFYQSGLPKGLAFVAPFWAVIPPWKHLAGAQPAYYNAMDNAVTTDIFLGVKATLEKQGRWEWFWRHCVEADEILVGMGERGMPVDVGEQAKFMGEVREQRAVEMEKLQVEVPEAAKGVKTWKRAPKEGTEGVVEWDGPALGEEKQLALSIPNKKGKLPKPPKLARQGEDGVWRERRWSKKLEFNPESKNQVIELIKALGLKVPTTKGDKGETRETTEAKHLKRLAVTKPVFHTLLVARQLGKMESTYNWVVDRDGLVHYSFGFHPSTWRKSCRDINIQNVPRRSELAQRFRMMVVAPPGHRLVEWDYAGIEAVLVGYFAGSERYIRLAKAGVHGWLVSCMVGEPIDLGLPFEELARRCKGMKRAHPRLYDQCKPICHGSAYMETAKGVYQNHPEQFGSFREAAALQDMLVSTEIWGDVKRWQQDTLNLASKERVLKLPWGYWHYFHHVFAWEKGAKQQKLGTDAKSACAFRPQGGASAIQTEALLRLRAGYREEQFMAWLRAIIHDSKVSVVPDERCGEVLEIGYREMIKPVEELPLPGGGCLEIGVEAKVSEVGGNWADWDEETNPGGMRVWEPGRVA